ncbi:MULTISPECIES: Ig-like domain-containing protein [unclassified Brevibacterium]|uniref:L,D-transpeptidase n=1 Tax=unclassified Brevibacterium TaxID=2614124 RepID=UPI001E508575|nr:MULTISPECIES: Ig-like domain-containing protein [unclassified Brevibacterium]MDK8436529.1 Ig-like domain-containing protein [Brevibacterium sp. H-BE7]
MSKKIQGALAALSVLALLTACTPSSSDPDSTRNDAKKSAEASPEPTFHVGAVSEAEAKAASADSDDETSDASESAAPTDSASPTASDSAQGGQAVESGSDIELEPGKRISLTVADAKFTDISITDSEHPRISADPGVFFDSTGAELDAEDEDAKAGSGSLGSTDDETEDSAEPSESSEPSESADSDETPKSDETAKSDEKKKSAVAAPDDATAWISDYDLVADSTYEVAATATTEDGQEHEFTTTVNVGASDSSPMAVRTVLSDDQTVGVAAPIILTFGSTVSKEYRDDVEHRLSVKVTDKDGKKRKVKGSWAWLPDDPESRLHFRPKDYWPAHSKVSVDAPLKNVPTGESSVGQNDLSLDFEIGREQVVEASAKTHRMTVTRDGKEIMDFPASLGAQKSPSYNGIHVVMAKAADYTMTSQQWDYETDVKWAVRIHNNGEFVHAAPWSAGSQGSANVSHGCINLSTERAKEYYDSAIYGDPVEITGSDVSLSTEASDISDWVYDWDDWKKLSALD